jgi:hypothetical protein
MATPFVKRRQQVLKPQNSIWTLSRQRPIASDRRPAATGEMLVSAKIRQAEGRRAPFDDDVVALFAELEAMPLRARKRDEFRLAERRLHQMLRIAGDAICSASSVFDSEPPSPDSYPAQATYREALRI